MPWDYIERNAYFKLNNIDPYKVLDVTKDTDPKKIRNNYKKLALLLHPDKSKKNSMEFMVLKECYIFIIEDQKELVSEDHTKRDMSSFLLARNDNEAISNESSFTLNDLNNPEIRKALLPESDVNVLAVPVGNADRSDPEINNFFGKKKKFDIKYFNAIFEIEKDLNKEIVLRDHQVKPYNETLDNDYAEIIMYNGEMTIKKPINKGDTSKKTINIENLSKKELKKLVDEKISKTKKIQREAYSVPSRPQVSVTKISEEIFEQDLIDKKNEQLRKNRDYLINQAENKKKLLLRIENGGI